MEVHHNPHPEKKSFKEYFFEGIMIFLAVTMGFIAENIREHITENSRAKELAKSLYQELYTDSIQLQKVIANRERKEKELSYIVNYVKDSSLNTVGPRFYRSLTWSFLITSPIVFDPADGMLTQLRNSGSLRYFKSILLQKQLGDLSVAIAKIRTRSENEASFSQQFIRPFVMKHYNFTWYNEITKQGAISVVDAILHEPDPKEIPAIKNAVLFNKIEAENMASYYQLILRATRQIQLKNFADINQELLATLRKEYNLKAE